MGQLLNYRLPCPRMHTCGEPQNTNGVRILVLFTFVTTNPPEGWTPNIDPLAFPNNKCSNLPLSRWCFRPLLNFPHGLWLHQHLMDHYSLKMPCTTLARYQTNSNGIDMDENISPIENPIFGILTKNVSLQHYIQIAMIQRVFEHALFSRLKVQMQ